MAKMHCTNLGPHVIEARPGLLNWQWRAHVLRLTALIGLVKVISSNCHSG